MGPVAWAILAAAAVVAAVAWRFARRSRPALAVAVCATSLAGIGLLFAALGYGGCSDRGDCGPFGGALRTILVLATLLLPVLVVVALVRAAWRRRHPAAPPNRRRRMRWRDIGFLALGGVFLV